VSQCQQTIVGSLKFLSIFFKKLSGKRAFRWNRIKHSHT